MTATTTGFGGGTNYNFEWTSKPVGTIITDRILPSPYPYQAGDVVGPGPYSITVTNQLNSCASTGTISLQSNPQPIDILTVSKTDQAICYADGSILVNSISSGIPGNYSYTWYRNSPTSTALVDGANATIVTSLLDKNNYVTMGGDIFFVTATKNPTILPGSGCTTPPFRIEVKNNHVDPRILLSSTSNSSCNVLLPNGTITADASEQSGANTDTYAFAWTLNGAALPPVTTLTNTNNRSFMDNSQQGGYKLIVTNVSNTGCSASSSINLILDQTRSTPNIVDVSWVDPLDCNPNVSATVTKITLGSTSNSLLFPPNVAPNNEVTGLALLNFNYEWYQGSFIAANQLPIGGPFTITPTNNALSSGKYFVIVQDPTTDCKSGPKEIVIKDDNIIYPVVNITQPLKQLSCIATLGTASLAATADGQSDVNPNYGFTWFNNLANTPPTFATTSTISNLLTGNYSVTVLDNTTACTSSAPFVVPEDKELYRPQISTGGQPRTFCVGQDGTILARVINFDPAYPFGAYTATTFTADLFVGAFTNPSGAPDVPNLPLVPGFIANYITPGLVQGFYTVRITDTNTGCAGVAVDQVKDERVNPVILVIEENPLTNCDPVRSNGQLSALADGKITGYNFDWYAGAAVPSPIGIAIGTNNVLIGKTSGSYTVRGSNIISGCFTDKTGIITDKTVIPPIPDPTVVFHRTNCILPGNTALPNGWVTTTVGGVIFNYTFDWYDGVAAKASPDFTGVDYRDVDIGNYSVTATDDVTGCISPIGTVEVLDKRVTPEFTIESTPSYCSDVGKPKGVGSILLNLTTPEVSIDVANWYEVSSGVLAGTGPAVYELFPGSYRVEVFSTEGCFNEGAGEVKTEIAPYNGVSSDGDSQNDFFVIDCITNFPNNNVKIFNRSGILVYETDFYNNADKAFTGIGLEGLYLQGKELPVGTYFYIIDKGDGSKPVAGYLELDR